MAKYICAFFALLVTAAAQAQVVISQVYGGGGNSGATYTNDFIEIFNAGNTAQDLAGWSVQYASSASSSWTNITNLPSVSLQPGKYFLVQEASGGANGVALPTPDAAGAINLSGTNGKVALVNATTALSGSCPTGGGIQDFVGYGTANCFEGSAAVPALSNTTAAIRNGNGCTDTNSNNLDFSAATPSPRHGATAANLCGGGGSTNPTGVGNANPNSVLAGAITLLTVAVTPGTNPASTGITVAADLSTIGGSATQTLYDDGTHGDVAAGDEVFSCSATVAAGTAAGPKSLAAAIGDAQARTGSATIALSVASPPVTVMQIQGNGIASPLVDQTVTTAGNIVTAVGAKGFFMQDPIGDGDVATSDGIYVFTNTAPMVQVGDAVTVTGKVQEYSGSTEIGVPSIQVNSSGNPVPAALVLDADPPSADPLNGICQGSIGSAGGPQAHNFACLDGMRVTINDGVVTGATFASGGSAISTGTPSGFYATVASQARPFREAGAVYPGLGGSEPVWDGDPEIVEIYYKGLGFDATDYVYDAGTHFSITGVLQAYQPSYQSWPIYEIYPIGMTTTPGARSYPQAVADSAAGTLTIGTQNMLRLFNDQVDSAPGVDDGCAVRGTQDVCPTTAQFTTRLHKLSKLVREVLKAPAVLGVQEIENLATLTSLANQINADAPALGYVPYLVEGNDIGGIDVGLLVRGDVTVNAVTQIGKNTQTNNCSGAPPCLLNDRPPLLLDASFNGYRFAVLVIHDRSLSGLGDPAKPYVGPKRLEQAQYAGEIVQAWQTGSAAALSDGDHVPNADANAALIVVGDYNAYEFSDGYADVTGQIKGTAVPADNLLWAMPKTNPTLIDSGIAAAPAARYSFAFDGYVQELDHMLLTRTGWKEFAAIANAHGNADVSEAGPAALDGSTAVRSADHDGQVLTLAVDRIFADGCEPQP